MCPPFAGQLLFARVSILSAEADLGGFDSLYPAPIGLALKLRCLRKRGPPSEHAIGAGSGITHGCLYVRFKYLLASAAFTNFSVLGSNFSF
jgi:hypothetical protein